MGILESVALFAGLSTVYLLGVSLLLKRFTRFYEQEEPTAPPSTSSNQPSDSSLDEITPSSGATTTDSTTVICPACGAENDREYTFCRNCTTGLWRATA